MTKRTDLPVACEGRIEPDQIPEYVGHNIAQVVYPTILRAWADPGIRAEYQRWKAERAADTTP